MVKMDPGHYRAVVAHSNPDFGFVLSDVVRRYTSSGVPQREAYVTDVDVVSTETGFLTALKANTPEIAIVGDDHWQADFWFDIINNCGSKKPQYVIAVGPASSETRGRELKAKGVDVYLELQLVSELRAGIYDALDAFFLGVVKVSPVLSSSTRRVGHASPQ